jgi:hypothetical protein
MQRHLAVLYQGNTRRSEAIAIDVNDVERARAGVVIVSGPLVLRIRAVRSHATGEVVRLLDERCAIVRVEAVVEAHYVVYEARLPARSSAAKRRSRTDRRMKTYSDTVRG